MKRIGNGWIGLWTGLVVWLLSARPSYGCAVCFGRSDSAMAEGMNAGIMTLLGFVVLMWVGVGSFFVYLARKSSSMSRARAPRQDEQVTESSAR